MKWQYASRMAVWGLVIGIGWAAVSWSSPQRPASATAPLSMVVSVEAKNGKEVPAIHREDVRVFVDKERAQTTGWIPLQADQAAIEIFVLIDDAIDPDVAQQFEELRQFMNKQPGTTSFGVGYIRNGTVAISQNITPDHLLAGKALRIPMSAGIGVSSPYLAVSDLMKQWPKKTERRNILMISDGIDLLEGGANTPYLVDAIDRAQQEGIQIYGIYASGAGHSGHNLWRINWGQNNLSQLAEETGGEAYFQGLQTPQSYAPYLGEIAERLKHQYLLTFLPESAKAGTYRSVRLETEVPNADLVGAYRVYIPQAK